MKIVSFWRTSLNDSESQRFYFDHFEIHPIKVSFFVDVSLSFNLNIDLICISESVLYFVDHCKLYPWGITIKLQLNAGGS